MSAMGDASKSLFMSGFFEELQRRKVYRVAAAYIIAAGFIIQIGSAVFPAWDLPNWTLRLVVVLFAEARELLPVDATIYHQAYGLRGLLESLDRTAKERRQASDNRAARATAVAAAPALGRPGRIDRPPLRRCWQATRPSLHLSSDRLARIGREFGK